MKERPILFNGPMIRAILADNKTQTRRILKSQGSGTKAMLGLANCHLGQPNDRLWVRETFAHIYRGNNKPESRRSYDVAYKANGFSVDPYVYGPWKPSIHMPRWASRINLAIKSVRVERLQDISEADALAEGITYGQLPDNPHDQQRARTWYRGLWEQINGAGSWDVNPWVWVIEFERIKP